MSKNILFILTDQQRKDSLGCYGNPVVRTPNLDRLAAQGVQFQRNYVANPICMPSRMSIFTGMFPRNHGVWTNGLLQEHERRTMATELSDLGYQTANFGKIHFQPYGAASDSGSMESLAFWKQAGDEYNWNGPYWGFEHVELTVGHTAPVSHYGTWFRDRGGTPEMLVLRSACGAKDSGVRELPPELHDSAFVAERTCRFLTEERDKSRPFFMVASFPDPHHPFNPPKEHAKRYPHDNVVDPVGGPEDLATRPAHYWDHYCGLWDRSGVRAEDEPIVVSTEQRNERIALTYAMVDLIDQSIGRILDTLERENLIEDTIIVFTSDHGELLGDHGLWYKGPFFYEGLVNVPLLITARGMLDPFVSSELISHVDLFPTLFDLLDLPVPDYVNGVSQKKHLLEPGFTVRNRCLIEYRNGFGANDCSTKAVVMKDWKYVRYQTGDCELTDLRNDPQETKNVAALPEYRSRLNEMNDCMLDELLGTESKWPKQVSHA